MQLRLNCVPYKNCVTLVFLDRLVQVVLKQTITMRACCAGHVKARNIWLLIKEIKLDLEPKSQLQ